MLVSIIEFSASHNSAFRVHRETLSLDLPENSENLTDVVKPLSEYDPVLSEHFRCMGENEIRDYLIKWRRVVKFYN